MPKLLFSAIVTSLLALVSTARAGQITNPQLYDGGSSQTASDLSMSTGDSRINSEDNPLAGFAGYDPTQNDSVQVWHATDYAGKTLSPDLVSTAHTDFHPDSVPEPSTAVVGGFGLMFVLRFVARNRARRREARR